MKKLYWNAEERVKKFLFGESFPEHELSEVLTGHGKIKMWEWASWKSDRNSRLVFIKS
jgi:hypothetical protein